MGHTCLPAWERVWTRRQPCMPPPRPVPADSSSRLCPEARGKALRPRRPGGPGLMVLFPARLPLHWPDLWSGVQGTRRDSASRRLRSDIRRCQPVHVRVRHRRQLGREAHRVTTVGQQTGRGSWPTRTSPVPARSTQPRRSGVEGSSPAPRCCPVCPHRPRPPDLLLNWATLGFSRSSLGPSGRGPRANSGSRDGAEPSAGLGVGRSRGLAGHWTGSGRVAACGPRPTLQCRHGQRTGGGSAQPLAALGPGCALATCLPPGCPVPPKVRARKDCEGRGLSPHS